MRALVSIFTVLLIAISVYQLSFTWFVNKHEKAMKEVATQQVKRAFSDPAQKYPGNAELQSLYQDTIDHYYQERLEKILDSTNDQTITWWGQSYQKAKENELLLGLDLQGGINVTLDVALDGLIKGLANNPKDASLLKAIEEAQTRKLNSDQNFIDLFAASFKSQNPTIRLAPLFANTNKNKLSINASDDQVVSYIREQANAAMQQTYQVLTRRIDKFGVAQPNISLDQNKGIITVELAGATNPERIRKYLQSTANLQFFEVYTLNDQVMIAAIQNADRALGTALYGSKGTLTPAATDSATLAAGDSATAALSDSAIRASQANPLFRVLMPAQPYQDAAGRQSFGSSIGRSLISDTAKVNSYLRIPAVAANFPANAKFLWGKQERDANGKMLNFLDLYAIQTIPGKEGALLEGSAIESADQSFDPITNDVLVNMSMNTAGARVWAQMTERSAKDNRPIAIVLDDIVYSAPVASEKIEGGNSRITMGRGARNNTQLVVEEAQDLANILKAGKLEAPARIVQDQVVGPTLGQDAVNGGMLSFSISFLVIFILMLVYYNTGGIVANIALILNLLFTIGVLSALKATLTAPGIAGLVLTIGMAVDTNVIIFERIKDELNRGSSHAQAVKLGYHRSLPPVLDGHITSLMTAIILAIYGLGPVLGFATTQIIGILLSLFCGILVSRLVTEFYMNKDRHFNYFTKVSRRVFRNANYNFIKYRKYAYVISAVIFVLGVGTFFNGFKEGVEFSGGRSFVVKFDSPQKSEEIREALEKVFDESPIVKTYGPNGDQFDITTDYLIHQEGQAADSIVLNALYAGLKPLLPATVTQEQFTQGNKYIQGTKRVDATISDDLKSGAKWATFWSVLCVTIYIFLRFRDWRYSIGTLVALMHDVLVTLIVFSYFKNIVPFPLEIDQHFIAAILTVIGFSMNDTVVVYDRIREYSHTMRNATKAQIINRAINDTLSRTIMTSLTVFLTILILFLVGGEVTKGFAFAMLIGVITGCYSSIFVAAPILVDFRKNRELGDSVSVPAAAAGKPQPALTKQNV
ncbi:MAG TPA: protein translocase subunit SecDF [Flavitalea sp.]|nr:protein translocase subunit SecDF [Flavitalea sp.]